ncbi:MAG: HAD family hydrolase [Thermoplasmata archaeon]|nr:HAD family hydrolase [Thermoplasmata archaeon]
MPVAIIFDLDNTLYDAEQYFRQAFQNISEYLSKKYPENPRRKIYNVLFSLWRKKTSMYPKLFDEALEILGIKEPVDSLIWVFDNCQIKLTPYRDAICILKKLKRDDHKLGLLTDGKINRQNRKIDSLGIREFFDAIVVCEETGFRKPSPVPYRYILNKLGISPHLSIYVGDNPLIDFEGAKKAGMHTVRILRGEFRTYKSNSFVDWEIDKFKELIGVIREIEVRVNEGTGNSTTSG